MKSDFFFQIVLVHSPLELNSHWLLLQLSSFLETLGLLHDTLAKKINNYEKERLEY